ncbi:glycoside hydrolase family 13 protein [Alicyclobacillus mengziensis]|uniref:oligo-1,6-glucosidase n=1 Tax=Alicyclobacillus mengziensis TaxID=2931921 RepID=A0A9X7VYH7_9BACL|nr:alpha-glucosidase [Alicyclobacillus mengziensis]QSO46935.1 alpha-glucosidase [Alicyclobacillus mengziensis]
MQRKWWKEAVVYQIYPRSFMDSSGDGVGDLNGITSRLDYLSDLGVDVIWLCPIYRSPNDDYGYDITDYRAIMDEFGTMRHFERLLSEVHARGMKLVMDLVINHTSDEHEWFVEARSSKGSPYRDYYIWRPGKNGREPNNWRSIFGGPAWRYDATTDEYYLHLFSVRQPDLNWDNDSVRDGVYDMMTWWLDKGIDGFRMDVINCIAKADGLPDGLDADANGYASGDLYYRNLPKAHEYLQEMNRRVLSRYDIMTVGETGGVTPEDALLFAGEDRGELDMVFQFEHVDKLDSGPNGKWDIKPWRLCDMKEIMSRWQNDLYGRAWNSLYFNNHDQPRAISRFADDGKFRVPAAKMLATFLHMMQGTPFIYQGEEIGMTNAHFERIEDYRDVEVHNLWRDRVLEGGEEPAAVLRVLAAKARDNARTPMQWDDSEYAGFTSGTPWIPVNANYTDINVKQAMSDEDSVYHYYRRLIRLRKQNQVMVYGKYRLILPDHPQVYAYTRTLEDECWLVVNNFFAEEAEFSLPDDLAWRDSSLVIGNYPVSDHDSVQSFTLRPYETRVYRIHK